jgi:RNA polymerase sigma factor (sigma-70 family)
VRPRSRARRTPAFTLVALLVVIALIALLSAILLPALSSARRQARAVQCASNIRQICIAITNYTADFKGKHPPNITIPSPGTLWWDAARVGGYLMKADPPGEKVLACPEEDGGRRSYSMNIWMSCKVDKYVTDPVPAPGELWGPASRQSSQVILIAESWAGNGSNTVGWSTWATIGARGGKPGSRFGGGGWHRAAVRRRKMRPRQLRAGLQPTSQARRLGGRLAAQGRAEHRVRRRPRRAQDRSRAGRPRHGQEHDGQPVVAARRRAGRRTMNATNAMNAQSPESQAATPGEIQLLLHAERAKVLAYVRRHLPAELAAAFDPQDLLQDVYFEAFRRMGQFAPTDSTSAYRWLVTIARHRIAELLRMKRAAKRGGHAQAAAQGGSVVAVLGELAVHRNTPSRSAAGHEFIRALEAAIARLPPDLGQALGLRYIDGLSPAEIARRMGRSDRAVHMLCNRALKAVRLELRSASLFM